MHNACSAFALHATTIATRCFVLLLILLGPIVHAAELKTKNVFLITTDGLRWQEVFTGAEELLMNKTNGGVVNTNSLRDVFWRDTPEARRQALLPFLWGEIAAKGQLYGNQLKGSVARVTNGKNFSYPGYSEFLTGAADARIDSNNKIPNPNTNVFEWLNLQPEFHGKVAAVVNWDVIPWILNAGRSRLPVWTGFPLPADAPVAKMVSPALEELARDTTPLWGNMILDSFTFHAARDYVKSAKPRAFYVAFGETDEWAHEGRYDHYLRAANHVDRFLRALWETVQSLPEYRDKTTFIITTDHGRGTGPVAWRNHSAALATAGDIWLAILGPDTPPLGERTNCAPVTQSQVAATIAAFLGMDFNAFNPKAAKPIGDAIRGRTK
ncbi:MAG: AP protein [Verrucomicrobia bacterium]|nr:AP protein [Verrucomicrobiota bacterium]